MLGVYRKPTYVRWYIEVAELLVYVRSASMQAFFSRLFHIYTVWEWRVSKCPPLRPSSVI